MKAVYIQIMIMCFLILGFIWCEVFKNKTGDLRRKIQLRTVVFLMLFIFFDYLLCMAELKEYTFSYTVLYIINILYNLSVSLMIFSLAQFTYLIITGRKKLYKYLIYIFGVIGILGFLFAIFSPFNELFIKINEGEIEYGPLDTIFYVIEYSPLFITFIFSLIEFLDKKNYARKDSLVCYLVFAIFYVITGAIQIFISSLSVVGIGATLTCAYYYTTQVKTRIHHDNLTNLSNSRQLFSDLDEVIKQHNANNFYLFMLDLDDFKLINDTFGHIEGDIVLKDFSNLLIDITSRYSAKTYRYAGDEFSIILRKQKDYEEEELKKEIIDKTKALYQNLNKGFVLSVSVGYYRFDDDVKSIPDFIDKADDELYIMKNEYHKRFEI